MADHHQQQQQEQEQGILLYYKYVHLLGHETAVAAWYEQLCAALHQKGRLRVAADGVNVTVGGSLVGIAAHVAAVKRHPVLQGDDIDFKVAASAGALSEATRAESGFDDLRVAVCKVS